MEESLNRSIYTDWTQAWIRRFGSNMIKGDSRTAGETIIRLDSREEIKFDPKSPDQRPRDRLCPNCGQPSSPLEPRCNQCVKKNRKK